MANTADSTDRGHPDWSAAAQIDDILKTVRHAPVWSMSAAETREAMVELTRLEAQIVELQLRVAHHAQAVEVEADSGATSTANWWAHATNQTRSAAHRKTRLAAALGSEAFEPVRAALAEGRLLVDQAQVIVTAVDALPADLDLAVVAEAQATLVGYADTTTPRSCGSSGTVTSRWSLPRSARPTKPNARREERAAEAAATFRMVEDGHGKCHGRFNVSSLHGAMLKKQLSAIAAPKHRTHVDGRAPNPAARPHTGWGRRLRSTSRPTPPTGSPKPAASRPPWW